MNNSSNSSNNRKAEQRLTTSSKGIRSPTLSVSIKTILLVIIVSFLPPFSYRAEGKPGKDFDFSDVWKDKSSSSSSSSSSSFEYNDKFDFDFDHDNERMDLIVQIIVGVVVFVIVAIFTCILCLCCPICILAKMRSRRRGVVYRSAATAPNGTTVTTTQNRGNTTITIGVPRAQTTPLQATPTAVPSSNPSMIAISNNSNQPNKPYPVQQSVTVLPVMPVTSHQSQSPYPYHQPQHQHQGYSNQPTYPPPQMPQPPAKDQYNPEQYNPTELPPPYPGLSREMDSNNLPYNPYYSDAPTASAPSMKH